MSSPQLPAPTLYDHLQSLLISQQDSEDRARARGSSYIRAFGLYIHPKDGRPWFRQRVRRNALPGPSAGRVMSLATQLLSNKLPGLQQQTIQDLLPDLADGSPGPELWISVLTFSTGVPELELVSGWVLSDRTSSTGFSPGSLRAMTHKARYLVRREYLHLVGADLIAEAACVSFHSDILAVVAREIKADAGILWSYNSVKKCFESEATWGINGDLRKIAVPSTRREGTGVLHGIVGRLTPEMTRVVYDSENSSFWEPPDNGVTWRPRDETLFRDNSWRSCIAYPINSDGYLVGALSFYSEKSAGELLRNQKTIPLPLIEAALQGVLRAKDEVNVVEAIERRFDEDFAQSAVSLSVIGHVHDLAKMTRQLRPLLRDAQEYAESRASHRIIIDKLGEAIDTADQLSALGQRMKRVAMGSNAGESNVNVNTLIKDLWLLLEQNVKATDASCELISRVTMPARGYTYEVVVDPNKLERVIINLVDNAAFWASLGGNPRPSVIVRAAPAPMSGFDTGVLIEVEDNGPGIAVEIKGKIFDRFFTTRKGEGGMGLGLYLVKRFVAEMQGQVEVSTSRPGKTVFTVLIPSKSVDTKAGAR